MIGRNGAGREQAQYSYHSRARDRSSTQSLRPRRVEEIIRQLSPHTDAEGNAGQRLMNMCSVTGAGCARWYLGRNPESSKPNYAEIVVRTTDGRLTSDYVNEIRRVVRLRP